MPEPLKLPTRDATGVTYTPDIVDSGDWARDLQHMRSAGLTLVRSGEFAWSWYEAEPGKWDFSPLLRYMDKVEEAGLKLVLSTPTATAPPWMERLIPDMRMQDAHGRPFMGFRHFSCRNHPEVLSCIEKLIQSLAGSVSGHPALVGWQIDNEPHFGDTVQAGSIEQWVDFHPFAWKAFIAWLEIQAGTPAQLDERWHAGFWSQRARVWEDVSVHHVLNNPHARLDWLSWRSENLAGHLRWQAGLLRQATPGLPVGINVPVVPPSQLLRCGIDYSKLATGMDWIGADLYQASGDRQTDMARLACKADLVRSFCGDAQFLVAEAQGGAHARVYNGWFAEEPFGADYLEACWEQFSRHGAEAVWWFQWRPAMGGFEHGMNGIQSIEGKDTVYTEIIRDLSAKPMSAGFQIIKEKPLVRVAHLMDSFSFLSFWPHQMPQIDRDLHGWHELLEEVGFRVDFLGDEELEALEPDGDIPLVLPVAPVLSKPQRFRLRVYPGPVFLGPSSGFYLETGHLSQPEGCWMEACLPVNWSRWQDAGHWHSPGDFPKPAFRRRMRLKPGSLALQADEEGEPWLARSANHIACGLPLGELYALSDSRQRAKLAKVIQAALQGIEENYYY